MNSLQGPTASRPVREFRTSGEICVGGSSISALSKLDPHPFIDGPEESPALAAQLRAFSVISSSLRAELSTPRNHSVGKVSAFADVSIDRSHPLSVCQWYCGRRQSLRHRPLPQCLSGRGSFLHASQALRPEKRGSPLPMGRTGTDSIPLMLHCVRTRPAPKAVRLRLVLFDARFILSGSVVHYVPDTSLRGRAKTRDCDSLCSATLHTVSPRLAERNRSVDTPLPIVPGLCAPGATVPALRLRDFRRLRRAHSGLVSVHGSIPYASTPSPKPLPPARLTRPKVVAVVPSFSSRCQSRKNHHLSPRPSYRPAPAAPIGLPAHSPEDRKNDADASPFPTSCESSENMITRSKISA